MTAPDAPPPFSPSALLSTLRTGLCVLRVELGRMAVGVLRCTEARQLRRRMDEEHAALGRLVLERLEAGGLATDDVHIHELAGRAAFLRDEMARHAAGTEADRLRHLARMARCRDAGRKD